jgi:hypothetical protein
MKEIAYDGLSLYEEYIKMYVAERRCMWRKASICYATAIYIRQCLDDNFSESEMDVIQEDAKVEAYKMKVRAI